MRIARASLICLLVAAGCQKPQGTCPVAGCWFRLRDGTGVIKVDTKSAGFVVVNLPLGIPMTVAGKAVAEGDEVMIEATGIRY